MIRHFLLPLFVLGFFPAAWGETVEYRIVSGGANKITLELDKTGVMRGKKHNFEFPKFDGKLSFDAAAPQNSRVELKIDSAAVICNDTWLKESDRKKVLDYTLTDMLAVKQYPEMRFVSSKVTPKADGKYTVEGTLTIRGNGRPVVLEAALTQGAMTIDGNSILKITSFGLKPPSAGFGLAGTKDEMRAQFHIVAQR